MGEDNPLALPEGGWPAAMAVAIDEARGALDHGDVPVGAVVYDGSGAMLAVGHNEREALGDPLAHAEIVAMRNAARARGGWRLDDCTLVVTLEPCVMCAGAIAQARLARVVFGAFDPKAGAVASLFDVLRDPRLPHRPVVVSGIRAEECVEQLRRYFEGLRRPQVR